MRGPGPRHDKTERQRNAIPILLTARTRTEACKAIGIQRETLYQWFKEEEFLKLYRDAQRELYDGAMNKMLAKLDAAVDYLGGVLTDPDAPAAVKVQAAKIIIERCTAQNDSFELEERILALEKLLTGKTPLPVAPPN
jgi:hypothetical protein